MAPRPRARDVLWRGHNRRAPPKRGIEQLKSTPGQLSPMPGYPPVMGCLPRRVTGHPAVCRKTRHEHPPGARAGRARCRAMVHPPGARKDPPACVPARRGPHEGTHPGAYPSGGLAIGNRCPRGGHGIPPRAGRSYDPEGMQAQRTAPHRPGRGQLLAVQHARFQAHSPRSREVRGKARRYGEFPPIRQCPPGGQARELPQRCNNPLRATTRLPRVTTRRLVPRSSLREWRMPPYAKRAEQ